MLSAISIEEIDRLLNELEQLARGSSRKQFFDSALERLRFLLKASGTAVVVRPTAEQWISIAESGAVRAAVLERFPANPSPQAYWLADDFKVLAVPIRKSFAGEAQWQRGALLVEFDQPPGRGDVEELSKLCDAFAEILALRQWTELEDFLDRKWLNFQRSLTGLANCASLREAAYVVVNDLAGLVKADRVSLVRGAGVAGPRMLAVSGVAKLDPRTATSSAIRQVCDETIREQRPRAQHASHPKHSASPSRPASGRDASGRDTVLLGNYICVPVLAQHPKGQQCAAAVLLEWNEYEQFLFGCSTLNYLFPAIAASWLQHQRWLSVPYAVRRFFSFRQPGSLNRWAVCGGRAAVAALLVVGVLWAANRPTPLRIEAQGTLQPVEQQVIFAPLDGVVNQIVVRDGQRVAQGERLIVMSSPMLEIELQEVQGEIRANGEKRDGLNVAINQLANDDPAAYALQSKFSSEIRELETQLQTLRQKQQALQKEEQKLVVESPIEGYVIARQVERLLNSRPVRRGDSLLRVVRLDGPWQLELQVADRESGYLKRKMFDASGSLSGTVPPAAAREFEFVIASEPDSKLLARATWVSETARNPQGEEVVVDVLAEVDSTVAARGHMGATVYAYFDCGDRPFWFVWSRPLIEAIQRKLWF